MSRIEGRVRHLDLLNVTLALRFKQPGYPTCLSQLGYLVSGIGVTIPLSDGAKICPDVLASRDHVTLLVEVKGGRSFDDDQLGRYLRTSAVDLRDLGHLPIRDVGGHRVHVVYVCNEDERAAMTAAIAERPVSIVGFDGARFRVSGTPLADEALANCLTAATVDATAVPLDIVPFDEESDDEEVARALLPHVIGALHHGAGTIRAESLVAKTHHLVWDAMGSTGSGSEAKKVVARARAVLEKLTAGALSEWLVRLPKQPIWRFTKPLPNDTTRTRELQKLQRAVAKYLEDMGAKRGLQLGLFDEIDTTAEALMTSDTSQSATEEHREAEAAREQERVRRERNPAKAEDGTEARDAEGDSVEAEDEP